jgi:chloramphenicol O-acetyltransferase type A
LKNPFFATVTIDCTKAYATAKKYRPRFYLLPSQNVRSGKSYRCFKYRIAEDNVYVYDKLMPLPPSEEQTVLLVFLNRMILIMYVVLKNNNKSGRIKQLGLLRAGRQCDSFLGGTLVELHHFRASYTFLIVVPKISFGKMITADDGTKTMAMSMYITA